MDMASLIRRTNRPGTTVKIHGVQASRDRWRNIESEKHHPMTVLRPDRPHISHHKTKLGPRHFTHTHPHEEELGPHTNKPGPIRFPVRFTKKGIREKK